MGLGALAQEMKSFAPDHRGPDPVLLGKLAAKTALGGVPVNGALDGEEGSTKEGGGSCRQAKPTQDSRLRFQNEQDCGEEKEGGLEEPQINADQPRK